MWKKSLNYLKGMLKISNYRLPVTNILIATIWFIPGHSAVSNLIVFNSYHSQSFWETLSCRSDEVIFTDFAESFDRADHHSLVDILYKSGFGKPVFLGSNRFYQTQWIKEFRQIKFHQNIFGCSTRRSCPLLFFHYLLIGLKICFLFAV